MLAQHEDIKNNAVGAEDVSPGHRASALCSIFSFLKDSYIKTSQPETQSQLETVISTNINKTDHSRPDNRNFLGLLLFEIVDPLF